MAQNPSGSKSVATGLTRILWMKCILHDSGTATRQNPTRVKFLRNSNLKVLVSNDEN